MRISGRLNILKRLCAMVCEIEILLRYKKADVYEISYEIKNKFPTLDFLSEIQEKKSVPFSDIWRDAVSKSKLPINNNDRIFICGIGEKLGCCDLDGQLDIVEMEKSELNKMIKDAENDCLKKCRLYRTLGFLSGIFVLLIIV